MSDENKKRIISEIEVQTNDQKLELIYKLLRQRHELQQVCLEVLRGLEGENREPLIVSHWVSELQRVLFEEEIFLHCHRGFPDFIEEE
ncbi:MAG: hypothetical protein GQ574_04105 [Crocinitomix sp.]|nr:hypothetical protein [Crocinitomix sp.]